MNEAYEHCEALVRERDRERFLSALFASAGKRPALFALYAFDLEIARVPDAVREPMAGEIRFQWWREVLAGERAEEATANPVAAALLETMQRNDLPVASLNEAIDARQFDLISQPMETREALIGYLDATSGAVIGLAARVLDPAWNATAAAKVAGRCLGAARTLRSFAHDVSKGRLFVPLDILAARDVHIASVLAGENTEALRNALGDIRAIAEQNLAAFRSFDVSPQALPAFLPLALVPAYLTRSNRLADPFRGSLELGALRSQFLLWRAGRRGSI